MSGNATLARPYAVAAFNYAKEKDALASWSDQLAFLAMVVSDATTRALIANPKFDTEKLEAFLLDLGGDVWDEGGGNFVRVLVHNGRISIAPEIAEGFEALRAQDDERVEVRVTSAYDLTEAQSTAIAAAMKIKFAREVNITSTTDADLMAGMIIRVADTVVDASLRGRMNQLALDLAR